MKRLFASLITVLALTTGVFAQEEEHIRFRPGPTSADGELQIAVTEFTNQEGVRVTLYGVVHIADQAYYDQIQADLDEFDSVLYEGVKQGTTPSTETQGLNAVQTMMGDVLGFVFQKEGIDYNRAHFVHADVDIDQLQESLDGQSVNPLDQYISPQMQQQLAPLIDLLGAFVKSYMDSNPDLRNQFQMQMAQKLTETDIEESLPPQMRQAIIYDRNQIVMDVLAEELRNNPQNTSIAIFYGAGHNADFKDRLEALGYAETNKRWMTAWFIGNGAQ